MSTNVVSAGLTVDQMDAIVKKLGGHDGALRLLSDELVVSERVKRWREVGDVIYLTVTLDKPMTGDKWILRLEENDHRASNYVKTLLRSKNFTSSAVGTYQIVILKGSLFEDNDRNLQKILAKGKEMNLQTPNTDIACLIREQISDKEIEEMGLWWIITIHEPIQDSEGIPNFLAVDRCNNGHRLNACSDYPGSRWTRGDGCAFLASQVL